MGCKRSCGAGEYIISTCPLAASTGVICGKCKASCAAGSYLSGVCDGKGYSDVDCLACREQCAEGEYMTSLCTGLGTQVWTFSSVGHELMCLLLHRQHEIFVCLIFVCLFVCMHTHTFMNLYAFKDQKDVTCKTTSTNSHENTHRTPHNAWPAVLAVGLISTCAARAPTATAHKTSSVWNARSAPQARTLRASALGTRLRTISSVCRARRAAPLGSTWLGEIGAWAHVYGIFFLVISLLCAAHILCSRYHMCHRMHAYIPEHNHNILQQAECMPP
jgi:hypothetical protein